jgi:hypothetical protein
LRHVAPYEAVEEPGSDPPCFAVIQDDSSRNVTVVEAPSGGSGREPEGAPTTADDALKLAIRFAVDAGDYEQASALLEVARRVAARVIGER